MPCVYYRHPSSAAWIPAPSGCRLRRSVGLESGIRGRAGALSVGATGGTFDPAESGPLIVEFTKTEFLSVDETWTPRVSSIDRGVENAKNSHWYLEPLCLWLLDTESQLRIGEKTLSSAKKRSQTALRPTDIPRVQFWCPCIKHNGAQWRHCA